MRYLIIVLCLGLPAIAGDDVRSLVDRLFSESVSERESARKALLARGDGVVKQILAEIEARQPGPAVVQFYDVSDLSTDAKNWKLALARLRTSAKGAPTFKVTDGVLVVSGDKKLHGRVQAELAAVREFFGTLVQLEVRILKSKPSKEALPTVLRADQVDGLIKRLGAEVISAPKLTCYNGQNATVTALEQVSFIQEFSVEEKDGVFLLDPTVGIAQDGVSLDIRPVAGTDGTVRLVATATLTRLQRPFPTLKVPTIAGQAGEIQIPELRSSHVRKLLTCEPGHVAVLDLGGGDVLLVTASKLMLDG